MSCTCSRSSLHNFLGIPILTNGRIVVDVVAMVPVIALAVFLAYYTALVWTIPTTSISLFLDAVAAPVRPPKGSANVTSLDANFEGSGCRSGKVSSQLASDNSALTIIFDDFAAADGPKAITSHTRALCKVNIGMTSPGWAFDIDSADFRGYVYLEKGVNASLVSRWKWIDSSGIDLKGKVCDNTLLEFVRWSSRIF